MSAFTYIVECADGTLYTGWTVDVKQRLLAHNQKKGAKYTRMRVPVVLVYVESLNSKQLAQKREYEIKQLSRQDKLQLIAKAKQTIDTK